EFGRGHHDRRQRGLQPADGDREQAGGAGRLRQVRAGWPGQRPALAGAAAAGRAGGAPPPPAARAVRAAGQAEGAV
ncbi:MAG: hypothetical protein AVDCRST_MAG18-1522, partial [uncultured Thermomicrobiales bacterium]